MRENIVLTGFMGTGKSVVGRKLSDLLHMDFLDTDEEIEKQHDISVYPIITLNDVVDYLKEENIFTEQIEHLNAYRLKYGANI